jgi:hypothetical protein
MYLPSIKSRLFYLSEDWEKWSAIFIARMLARIMETCERREFIAATEAFGEKPRAIHLRSQPGSGQILAPSEFGVLGIPGNQIINIGFPGSKIGASCDE